MTTSQIRLFARLAIVVGSLSLIAGIIQLAIGNFQISPLVGGVFVAGAGTLSLLVSGTE